MTLRVFKSGELKMDRSQKSSRIPSPVKYYLSFNGSKGVWTYFDGEAKDIEVLSFVPMATKSSIIGWSEEYKSRIYSNFVETTSEPLTVKAGKNTVAVGLYADIKSDVAAAGGKFAANIFAMAHVGEEIVPVNIQLASSVLAKWSDFVKVHGRKIFQYEIVAVKGDKQKNGAVSYYVPNFTQKDSDPDMANLADSFLENQLKPYFEQKAENE
jgi:hypothetical protein